MKKKLLIILAVLIMAVIAILMIVFMKIEQEQLRNRIDALVKTASENKNYTYEFKTDSEANSHIKIYRKDDKAKEIASDNLTIYEDYKKDEIISLLKENKNKVVGNKDTMMGIEEVNLYATNYLNSDKYEYKYIKEKPNSYEIELKNKKDTEEKLIITINKQTGLLEKIQHTTIKDKETIAYDSGTYNITLNNTTDKDVAVPDTTQYATIVAPKRETK